MNAMHRRAPGAARLLGAAVLAAASSVLGACASSGTKVTADQVAQFKAGVTTEAEVIAALGPPNSASTQADGSKLDMYLHISHSTNAASFVPVLGLLKGGASISHERVMFTFDPKGILKSIASSASHNDVNTGLLNQK